MEPISLSAGVIATLVLTKAIEKTGEKLGEKTLEKSADLLKMLKRKSPDTAKAIELATQNPELSQQKPEDYGIAILQAKVEEAAQLDSEVAEAVEAVASEINSKPASIQNFTKLAEKIGMLVQGGTINNPTINI
jgi:hypothetical protein